MAKPCTPHLIAQRVQLFKLQARNVNFLWEGVREGYLFLKKRYPSLTPSQRKFALQACSSKSCGAYRLLLAARGKAALSATIRFASAPTIRCRSAHLVEVQTNLLLPTMHTVSIMRTAASEAMPLRQAIPGLIESEVERSYVRVMNRRQSDSEDRSKSNRLDIKQGRHLIRQALQFFELLACNVGPFSWGSKGDILFPRKENIPLIRIPCMVQGTSICPLAKAIVAAILQKAPFGHNYRK